jgi:hypothetical protein
LCDLDVLQKNSKKFSKGGAYQGRNTSGLKVINLQKLALIVGSGLPRIFFLREGGGSTNSVEERGQREWESGGRLPPGQGFHSIFK